METYITLDDVPLMLTVEETAQLLRISRNTAYKYAKSGRIKSITICKQIRIPKSELLEMIAGQTAK